MNEDDDDSCTLYVIVVANELLPKNYKLNNYILPIFCKELLLIVVYEDCRPSLQYKIAWIFSL